MAEIEAATMNWHAQLRAGGWLIILASLLMNGTNLVVFAGYHNAVIQALYGLGFTGLILAATFIHLAQSRQAGWYGWLGYLISILSLAISNVFTFLILAELAGLEGARQTSLNLWTPWMHGAVYGIFIGWILMGISIATAGVLPRGAGILIALGVSLQLPAQLAIDIAGPLFFLFTIGGTLLTGAGLIWVGWRLVAGHSASDLQPGLSARDLTWGAGFIGLTGLLLAVDAALNMLAGLSLASGLTHLVGNLALIPMSWLLYAAHGEKVRGTGFAALLCAQWGAAWYMISAYLIVAQLLGPIDNNLMLMASWEQIPVGQIGSYLGILGAALFGVEAIRTKVFPAAAGWLVLLGIALALPSIFSVQAYFLGIFWVLGALLEGLGFAWMGWTLWQQRARRPALALDHPTS